MKIFLDSADLWQMLDLEPKVDGFTTNPTLMRKAGVQNYKAWALDALSRIKDKPISFEVFADDFPTMEKQAREIASWGPNVYVKIPITNTKGDYSVPLLKALQDIKVNVTAVMTEEQLKAVIPCKPAIISIFAGRMADTQVDPYYLVYAASYLKHNQTEILWASAREIFNVYWANQARADIITLTPDLIAKLPLKGKDLTEYSLDTVKMFHDDARKAGYTL